MIYVGHVLAELAKLDAESVSCVCTSPPYWSLRKYDAPDAVGGDQLWCPHPFGWDEITRRVEDNNGLQGSTLTSRASAAKRQAWHDGKCGTM